MRDVTIFIIWLGFQKRGAAVSDWALLEYQLSWDAIPFQKINIGNANSNSLFVIFIATKKD